RRSPLPCGGVRPPAEQKFDLDQCRRDLDVTAPARLPPADNRRACTTGSGGSDTLEGTRAGCPPGGPSGPGNTSTPIRASDDTTKPAVIATLTPPELSGPSTNTQTRVCWSCTGEWNHEKTKDLHRTRW